jgi:hypothetical protein
MKGRHDQGEQDIDFANNGCIPSAIPDGDQYEVSFVRCEEAKLWGRNKKIFLHFKMLTPGPYVGETFYMCCTVEPDGKWRPSFKYWRMWVLANGKQPLRGDRMSTKVFRNKVFRARFRKVVRTDKFKVIRTHEQQYSVIDELLGVLVG